MGEYSDSEDDEDCRPGNKDTSSIRLSLLNAVKEKLNDGQEVKHSMAGYKKMLEKCAKDDKDINKTILHWIVNIASSHDRSDRLFFEAAETLVDIAMEHDETLIKEMDKRNDTPLHQAIMFEHRRGRKITERMIRAGKYSPFFKEAISMTNSTGENALHLAINRDWPVALQLITISDRKAFLQTRKLVQQGASHNDGNTPLHDAVDKGRVVFERPKCSEGDSMCKKCKKAAEDIDTSATAAVESVKMLIRRCGEALKTKNTKGESPYLYHIRTMETHYRPTAKQRLNHEATQASQAGPASTTTQGRVYAGNATGCSRVSCIDTARSIETVLVESNFSIGDFKDACSCFFGEDTDEYGTGCPFRPVRAIFGTAYQIYQKLLPTGTQTLSHVDLVLSTNVEQSGNEDRIAIFDHWSRNMESLKKMFNMLRNHGIKRILKVTIHDNEQTPSSDNTIQACLNGFDVRYLDWNEPDLCINVIRSGWEDDDEYRKTVDLFTSDLRLRISLIRKKLIIVSEHQFCIDSILNTKNYMKTIDDFLLKPAPTWRVNKAKKDKISQEDKIQTDQDHLASLSSTLGCVEEQIRQLIPSAVSEKINITESHGHADKDGHRSSEYKMIAPKRETVISSTTQNNDVAQHDFCYQEPTVIPGDVYIVHLHDAVGNQINVATHFTITPKVLDPPPASTKASDTRISTIPPEDSHSVVPDINRWVACVEAFRKKRFSPQKGKTKIKVALIDDGVDFYQLESSIRVPGWPALSGDSDDMPWWHSDGGHGTQMARMITNVCPEVQFLVAKLGGSSGGRLSNGNAAEAAKAVRWAIKNKVDIISMSWSILKSAQNEEDVASLEEQIKEAAKNNIIMYCAATDNNDYGENDKVFPHCTDTNAIRIVGSGTEAGKPSEFVNEKQVHYLFPGEGIKQLGDQSGSSAATALAAGLAALLLWCFQNSEKPQDISQIANPSAMGIVMENIKSDGTKWVNVTKILGKDEPSTIDGVVDYCVSALRVKGRG
ncbi:hypothetical protein FPOAC1_003766 [Fusarium poae]|uniref:hypothetical protein n=1 Tax=Fusarium poae TaxID=36050 RepID=UPI001CE95CCD|nr:hypothetical protein FPOAC1_003766 [Fusarium poae]KAG8677738.1 hypothetical protein FPOAC1_003766 [Fusarium poae]